MGCISIQKEQVALSWYQSGSTEEQREQAKKESSSRSVPRFWMDPGDTKTIIFLDDKEFCLWEHHVKIGDRWGNFFTCLKGMDPNDPKPCPFCLSGNKRQFSAFVTIIDCTGYTDKKTGKEHKYIRKLFPMTVTTLEKFVQRKKKRTSLVGAVWEVSRSGDNSPKIGDDWEHKGEADIDKDLKLHYKSAKDNKLHPPEPYDYLNIFEPLTEAEMRAVIANSGSSSGGKSYTGDGTYTPPDVGGDNDTIY